MQFNPEYLHNNIYDIYRRRTGLCARPSAAAPGQAARGRRNVRWDEYITTLQYEEEERLWLLTINIATCQHIAKLSLLDRDFHGPPH